MNSSDNLTRNLTLDFDAVGKKWVQRDKKARKARVFPANFPNGVVPLGGTTGRLATTSEPILPQTGGPFNRE
jgi:hypothetical protein